MEKSVQNRVKVVIAAVGLILLSRNAVALVVSQLLINFPDQSTTTAQLVVTLIAGMCIFGALLFGAMSTILTKKNLAILSLLVIFGGGVLGVAFGDTSIAIPLTASALIGLGLGVLSPLLAAVISDYFHDPKERAGAVSLQAVFVTIGGLLYPIIGGLLTAKYWTFNYYVFFISIPIVFIVVFLLPKGEVEPKTKTNTGEKIKIFTPALTCWLIEVFILCICWITFNTNITLVIRGFGFPNFVQLASYGLLAFSIGNLVAALILGPACRKLGKSLMSYALGITTIGLFCMYFAQSPDLLWLMYVAGALIGLGFGTFMPAGYVFIPQTVQRITIPKALSFFVAANALGSFINPYLITTTASMINDAIYTRFLLAGLLCLAVTIFGFATKKIKEVNANL